MKLEEPSTSIAYYSVDEAGDLTLFDARGRTIVGMPGVSHTFMIGAAMIAQPVAVAATLDVHVFVGIRRKARLAADFRAAYRRTGVKRGPESVYDDLVTRVFQNRPHLAEENRVVFARHGYGEYYTSRNPLTLERLMPVR